MVWKIHHIPHNLKIGTSILRPEAAQEEEQQVLQTKSFFKISVTTHPMTDTATQSR
jgi:hypothetical protein